MPALLDRLGAADAACELFRETADPIDATTVRLAVARAVSDLAEQPGDLLLLCRSAGLQLVGLLTASVLGRRVLLPAHDAPGYLDELAATGAIFVGDTDQGSRWHYLLAWPDRSRGPAAPLRGPAAPLRGDDIELVFFTSGTTGSPKPVAKPLSCLEAEALTLARLWPMPPGCSVEATVSHQHIFGLLYRVVLPVLAGHVSRTVPCDYWEQLADRLTETTILVTTPAHLTRLPDGLPWPRMRPAIVFSSTAPLPFRAAQTALGKLDQLPIEVYGSTETGGIAWRRQPAAETPWRLLPSVELTMERSGIAFVRSPFIGDGQPFQLADGLDLLSDGRFHLRGRLDRVVKVEGKRVSLARVEAALLALDEVDDVAVVDLPHRQGALAAVIVPTEPARAELQRLGAFRFSRSLRAAQASRLEPAERPKWWRFVREIPQNRQGKRAAATLRELFLAEPDDLPPHRLLEHSDKVAEIVLALDAGLVWFAGHFPGEPILAGVAQIHIARRFAEQLWQLPPLAGTVRRLKFHRVIRPGDDVHLHLEHLADGAAIRFRFEAEKRLASEGIIGDP